MLLAAHAFDGHSRRFCRRTGRLNSDMVVVLCGRSHSALGQLPSLNAGRPSGGTFSGGYLAITRHTDGEGRATPSLHDEYGSRCIPTFTRTSP